MASRSDIGEKPPKPSDPLAALLVDKVESWKQSRLPQEDRMVDWYSDYMRIAREADTKGVGVAKSKKAKGIFVGSTRNKCRAARARIKDSLFGQGDRMPFDAEPTQDNLKVLTDAIERILVKQLEDGDFRKVVGMGSGLLTFLGTGFIGGPFVREASLPTYELDEATLQLTETEFTYPEPYFKLWRTLNSYPDPVAEDVADGEGIFFEEVMHPSRVREWIGQDGYDSAACEAALKFAEAVQAGEGADRAIELRGAVQHIDGKQIRVFHYYGLIPRKYMGLEDEETEPDRTDSAEPMRDGSSTVNDAEDMGPLVEVVVTMAGGFVCRKALSSWRRRPAYRCVFEEVEHELWGVGIAENNASNQKVINAAFRLYMTGKGIALLPPKSVDQSKFMPGEDFKIREDKTLHMKPNLTAEERLNAITFHYIQDPTQGWERAIEIAERFSDEDTAVNKYTQGNDARHLNETATGISIIMNAAALPAKEVMQNIDSMWIEPCLQALLEWDLEHLETDVVERLHGEETALAWASVKKFYEKKGSTSFMRWKATGASTYVVREVIAAKLAQFMTMVLSTPQIAEVVDVRALMEKVWAAAEMGGKSPVLSEQQLQQMRQQQVDPIAQMRATMDGVPKDSALFPAMMRRFLQGMGIQGPEVDFAVEVMMGRAVGEAQDVQAGVRKTLAQARKADADAMESRVNAARTAVEPVGAGT